MHSPPTTTTDAPSDLGSQLEQVIAEQWRLHAPELQAIFQHCDHIESSVQNQAIQEALRQEELSTQLQSYHATCGDFNVDIEAQFNGS